MERIRTVFVIAPYHYDYSVAAIIQGLNKIPDIKVFANSGYNHCLHPVVKLKTQKQVAKLADVTVLTHSALEGKYAQFVQPLLDEVKPDVFLDGSDYCEYEANPKDYKLYLKRELDPTQRPIENNVKPFIFAAEDRFFTRAAPTSIHRSLWAQKTQKMACIMTACDKRPWRFEVLERMKKNYENDSESFVGEIRTGEKPGNLDTGDRHFTGYFDKLFDSKISVDAWGCGGARQTGRFWESVANGCLVFYPPIEPYVWPNTFEADKHFVVYNNIEDLDNKLRYYMENDDEARIIAEEAWKHMARHHTTKVRGEEFISLCKRYL